MIQAVSQTLDTGVWLRRATDAKAQVSSATATTSGNLLQSTKFTPEKDAILITESAVQRQLYSFFLKQAKL
jgi:hypothetical protein